MHLCCPTLGHPFWPFAAYFFAVKHGIFGHLGNWISTWYRIVYPETWHCFLSVVKERTQSVGPVVRIQPLGFCGIKAVVVGDVVGSNDLEFKIWCTKTTYSEYGAIQNLFRIGCSFCCDESNHEQLNKTKQQKRTDLWARLLNTFQL